MSLRTKPRMISFLPVATLGFVMFEMGGASS